jgi:hypothetical protein
MIFGTFVTHSCLREPLRRSKAHGWVSSIPEPWLLGKALTNIVGGASSSS